MPSLAPRPNKVFTAPMAKVRINGQDIFLAQDVTFSETFDRADIAQLGQFGKVEQPVTGFSGTVTINAILSVLNGRGIPTDVRRDAPDVNTLFQTLVYYNGAGVDIAIVRQYSTGFDNTGLSIATAEETYMIAFNCVLQTQNIGIAVGAAGTNSLTFIYREPILQKNGVSAFLWGGQ